MKIVIQLHWLKSGLNPRRAFKTQAAFELFEDYLSRLSRFTATKVQGDLERESPATSETWICTPAKQATLWTSEQLAHELAKRQNHGIKGLRIVIGGAEGFSSKDLQILEPHLKWSFGPLTLPHELAAIVACEQIYRAFTILRKLPYHLKH